MDLGIFELVGRDFTSESSRGSCEAVLGGNLGWGLELLLDVEKVDCWGSYYDLYSISLLLILTHSRVLTGFTIKLGIVELVDQGVNHLD